jgi:hypothetical protein
MEQGDVVLLDNYKCMHGRNVFDGTRKHGVAWFEGWEGEEEMKADVSSSRRKEAITEPFFASSLYISQEYGASTEVSVGSSK